MFKYYCNTNSQTFKKSNLSSSLIQLAVSDAALKIKAAKKILSSLLR